MYLDVYKKPYVFGGRPSQIPKQVNEAGHRLSRFAQGEKGAQIIPIIFGDLRFLAKAAFQSSVL